ncbi:hypothetical protein KAS79_02685 [Candidatus Parcubacteria bacterium]|nr:hypothetical protein [Candidatus Parcubacteria bacterium]
MKQYKPFKKQQDQIKGKFKPRYPKSKKEEQEFGSGKINVMVCKKCEAVYWHKSWHHNLNQKSKENIKFVICPACQMIKDKKYEGEIILENVPEIYKKSIRILVENFGKRASGKDPMDRVISIKEKKVSRPSAERKRGASSRKEFKNLKDIRILTTENQLAVRLAKKINETYGKKLDVLISYSHQEDVVRIRIVF